MALNDQDLDRLRPLVEARESAARYHHTLGVEAAIARMGEIYLPDRVPELRAAALLHDVTKDITGNDQIALCRRLGVVLTEEDLRCPHILHAKSAAALIPLDFPAYATPDLVQAVARHTTGAVGMSTFDKLLFLADYIEAGRQYQDCIRLRKAFWDMPDGDRDRLIHLDLATYEELDFTVLYIQKHNGFVAHETLDARQDMRDRLRGVLPDMKMN